MLLLWYLWSKKTTALPYFKKTTYRIPEKKKRTNIILVCISSSWHRFLNSNSNVEFIKEQESKDFDNYYNIPNNPKEY
jgi:hypothetical protein